MSEPVMTDKKMLEHMYNLKTNPAYHILIEHMHQKHEEIEQELLTLTDPDEILLKHQEWKVCNALIEEFMHLPQQFINSLEQSENLQVEVNF